jgi:hypothetical protein
VRSVKVFERPNAALGSMFHATSISLTCGPRHHSVTFEASGTVNGQNLRGTFSAKGFYGWGPRAWTINETFFITSQLTRAMGHLGGGGPNSPKNITCKTPFHGRAGYSIFAGRQAFQGTARFQIRKDKFVEWL